MCVCGRRLDGCAVVGLQHIYIRCANNDYLKAKGVGTAYAFTLADPTKSQDTKVVNTEW